MTAKSGLVCKGESVVAFITKKMVMDMEFYELSPVGTTWNGLFGGMA